MMNDNPHKSYRILNLEGAWLELNKIETEVDGKKVENIEFKFSTTEDKTFTKKDGTEVTIKPNKNKLFSATMPFSLETYRAFNKLPNEMNEEDKDLFTKLFVNFKFSKDLFDDNETEDKVTRINKKKLRKLIYTSTVKIDNADYCFFKRGASKARTANVIFCKKEYYETLYNPCLLGLEFAQGEDYDITSMQAYTSLIMSGIIGIINIKPEEILIIDDVISPSFKAIQSLTKYNDNDIIEQFEDEYYVENNMTDGQVLMDESVYLENELLNEATCALLRNDFFKGNAVRTRLQEYYTANGIAKVHDMYRGWIDATKIKLVITPSACKYLKFADQFESEESCFLNWLENIPSEFGLVKTDHIGNYGYSNRLSYQMLNSMNLTKDEVETLMKDELAYYKLLKDNTLVDSKELRKLSKKAKEEERAKRNEMTYFLDLVKDKKEEELSSGDMIADLLNRNIDFRLTKKFKDWKNEQLQDYISNLRLGKIRIKNSIYAIMVSCPWEMLQATHSEGNKINKCIMDGYECYSPVFPTYGEGRFLLGIRNPQINAGNIVSFNNKYHEEYKWFGYYKDDRPRHNFVVFVNAYDCDLMNRAQGCDWDIDTIYLCNSPLLRQKALESQPYKENEIIKGYATPTNGIEGSKELKKYNNKSLAELDAYLGGSTAIIGKIVNKSAIFNAYMYHAINNCYSKEYIQACYNASSTLSSFSQVAIDMAKKTFKGLSLTKEMNNLNYTSYKNIEGENIQILEFKDVEVTDKETGDKKTEKHMIVPYFFKYVAKNNDYRILRHMDCSMDYLEQILDELDTKAMQTDNVEIKDLIIMQKELDGKAFNRDKIDNARMIIDKCQSTLDKNYYNKLDSEEEAKEKDNLRKWSKKEAIKALKELELNSKTVHRIILRAFGLDNNYKGQEILKLDKEGNKIYYTDKEGNKKILKYRELNDMTLLTLTVLYNAYRENFIKCFIEKKKELVTVEKIWK